MDAIIGNDAWPVGTRIQQAGRDGIHYATVVARMLVRSLGGNIVPVYVIQFAWDDRTEEYSEVTGYVYGAAFDTIQAHDSSFEVLKEVE